MKSSPVKSFVMDRSAFMLHRKIGSRYFALGCQTKDGSTGSESSKANRATIPVGANRRMIR
jgi:hypothetical protein